jgi:hypothetical protein
MMLFWASILIYVWAAPFSTTKEEGEVDEEYRENDLDETTGWGWGGSQGGGWGRVIVLGPMMQRSESVVQVL